MSALSYMIVVWGGTEGYLMKTLQVIQNKAARQVTKLSWFTPTRLLLHQCNWLSIKQLVVFHTVIQVWKIRQSSVPAGLNNRLQQLRTRSGMKGYLAIPHMESCLGKKSFLYWFECGFGPKLMGLSPRGATIGSLQK